MVIDRKASDNESFVWDYSFSGVILFLVQVVSLQQVRKGFYTVY